MNYNRNTIKGRVGYALEKIPSLRDNLNNLIRALWKTDLKKAGYDINILSAPQLLELMDNVTLSNARSIQRWWCKWQEESPAHRGPGWYKRKGIEEPKVRQEMIEAKENLLTS